MIISPPFGEEAPHADDEADDSVEKSLLFDLVEDESEEEGLLVATARVYIDSTCTLNWCCCCCCRMMLLVVVNETGVTVLVVRGDAVWASCA